MHAIGSSATVLVSSSPGGIEPGGCEPRGRGETGGCPAPRPASAVTEERDAFEVLYERYFGQVYRYFYARTSEGELAEDFTQEVFLRAFQGFGAYRHEGKPLVAWLMRIAHNMLVDHYRRAEKHKHILLEVDVRCGAGDPAEIAERESDLSEVREAMRGLPPNQAEVLSLRFGAGLSINEVGAVMGKSDGSVKTLQHSAVVKLRQLLNKNGTQDTPSPPNARRTAPPVTGVPPVGRV